MRKKIHKLLQDRANAGNKVRKSIMKMFPDGLVVYVSLSYKQKRLSRGIVTSTFWSTDGCITVRLDSGKVAKRQYTEVFTNEEFHANTTL